MNLALALATSKTAIVVTLGIAGYQSVTSAPTALLVVLWGLFAAAVVGRAVRQYREPDATSAEQ